MSHESIILSEGVTKPKGPYAHAVKAGDFVFVSGQGAMDARTGEYARGGIIEQTQQTLNNIEIILKKLGLGLSDVVKVTAFLHDMKNYSDFNAAYSEFFKKDLPARTTVQAVLPNEKMLIEIETVAIIRRA